MTPIRSWSNPRDRKQANVEMKATVRFLSTKITNSEKQEKFKYVLKGPFREGVRKLLILILENIQYKNSQKNLKILKQI
jgi:hypothetical protein